MRILILPARIERPDYYESEVKPTRVSGRNKPGKSPKPVNHGRLAANLAVFVFAFCIIGVSLYIHSALLGYEIVSLKQEISTLETSNNRLEYKIAQLSSLERVQAVAETKLQMCRPETGNMIALAQDSMANPITVPPASSGNTLAAEGNISIASLIQRLPMQILD